MEKIPSWTGVLLMAWFFVPGVSVFGPDATRTPRVNQTSHPESGGSQWTIRATTDEMTGQSRLQAVMVANADSNDRHGNFEVTATCTARILAFTIIYHSAFDKSLGFQQTQRDSMVTLYNGVGTMDTPKPEVNLRARIDDGNVISLVSVSDYHNQATVVFTRYAMGDALSRTPPGPGREDLLGDLKEMGMALGAAGRTSEAYHANIIRVELPLANGDAPILVIRPQDPSLRAYASRCAAVDPSAFVNDIKAPDGFVFGSEMVLPSRLFKGTAEAFATAFSGFLQRAAPATGFGVETSKQDAAFIAQVVRTCSQITPQMALSVTEKNTGRELLPELGDQYRNCFGYINVSDRLRNYNKETERAVMLTIDPLGPHGWRDGQGFWVRVYFSALKGDRVMVTPEDFIDVFLIARAMIIPAH
jgi:hypothetical protein